MLILDSAKVYDKEIAEILINSIERVNEIEELDLTDLYSLGVFLKLRNNCMIANGKG